MVRVEKRASPFIREIFKEHTGIYQWVPEASRICFGVILPVIFVKQQAVQKQQVKRCFTKRYSIGLFVNITIPSGEKSPFHQ